MREGKSERVKKNERKKRSKREKKSKMEKKSKRKREGGWEGGLIGRGQLNKGIGPTTILRPLVLETEGGGRL